MFNCNNGLYSSRTGMTTADDFPLLKLLEYSYFDEIRIGRPRSSGAQ